MSASLIGWIWAQEISSTAKLVLFALNEHTNIGEHGDWRVFPSQERVAKMSAVSKPTVIKAMKELTEAGVITVAHQHDKKRRQLQNLYWLQVPPPRHSHVSAVDQERAPSPLHTRRYWLASAGGMAEVVTG